MRGHSGANGLGRAAGSVATYRIAIVLVVVAVGVLGFFAIQPDISGQFHDDSLYLTVAKSLAEGDGYRHASVPTTPAQTKYPPLYPYLLSAVWRASPSFPQNLLWLKLTSVVVLMGITALGGAFYARYTGRMDPGGVAFSLLLGGNMVVFPFADYTLTELPFLLLCLAAFVIAHPARSPETASGRQVALLAVAVGLAFLIRQAAIPLIVAGAVYLSVGRRLRPLAMYLALVALVAAPWVLFKLAHAEASPNPLLSYYSAYEKSVPLLALDDPGYAVQIVLANVWYVARALDLSLVLPYAAGLRPFVYPLLLWGLWLLARRRPHFLLTFAVFYLTLILLWPFDPGRYSMPLVPLVLLSFIMGTAAAFERLRTLVEQPVPRWVLRSLVLLPLLAIVALDVAWIRVFLRPVPGKTRVAFSAWLDYSWTGFEETFDWIREHTEPDALLASAYDPMYYLFTGRQGVRPWIHRPETYFYPVSGGEPRMGPADDVRRALAELGIEYMVIDPIDGYVEGDAARELMEEVLAGYAEPPALAYISTDGLHRIYRLPSQDPISEGARDEP